MNYPARSVITAASLYLLLSGWVNGDWRPTVSSSYDARQGVLVVRISPPMAGASQYEVRVVSPDDGTVSAGRAVLVNQTTQEVVYEVRSLPTGVERTYKVLVRAGVKGAYLSDVIASDVIVVSLQQVFSTVLPDPGHTEEGPVKRGGHSLVEKLFFVAAGLVVFFFIVFICVMLYVGRGCRASSRRRLSVRSRTSQGTTSESLFPSDPGPPRHHELVSLTPPTQHVQPGLRDPRAPPPGNGPAPSHHAPRHDSCDNDSEVFEI